MVRTKEEVQKEIENTQLKLDFIYNEMDFYEHVLRDLEFDYGKIEGKLYELKNEYLSST